MQLLFGPWCNISPLKCKTEITNHPPPPPPLFLFFSAYINIGFVIWTDETCLVAFASVTQILVVFVKTFNKSRDENERQADAEKKKLEKEAMKERTAANSSTRRDGVQQSGMKQHETHINS